MQIHLTEVESLSSTEWTGDFWMLDYPQHLKIVKLLEEDDPGIQIIFRRLRNFKVPSRTASTRNRNAQNGLHAGTIPFDPANTVPVMFQLIADSLKRDVFTTCNSHTHKPGFAIHATYNFIDLSLFNALFKGWRQKEITRHGFQADWSSALEGNHGFILVVYEDFDSDILHEWCDFRRFCDRGSGAAIRRTDECYRILLRMEATLTANFKRQIGSQITCVTKLWIATYGPYGHINDAASNNTYFDDYESRITQIKKKCESLYPKAAGFQMDAKVDSILAAPETTIPLLDVVDAQIILQMDASYAW